MQHPNTILRAHGLRASKKRGQNFLTQFATARAIVRAAGITKQDWVVEIGAGLGTLTLALAEAAERVIAVEVDRGVFAALREVLDQAGAHNVEPRLTDALKLDWAALADEAGRPVAAAGNLPYVISTPLLSSLAEARSSWRTAALMVQREMAERLTAAPGGRDYGRLSVLMQTWCRLRMGLKAGPDQFFPRPAVSSRVVHLEPRAEPLVKFADQDQAAWFNLVVKAAFGQRRKTLLNSLTGGLGMTREQVEAALKEAGIDPRRRAETLSSPEFGLTAQSLARRREGA